MVRAMNQMIHKRMVLIGVEPLEAAPYFLAKAFVEEICVGVFSRLISI